MSKKQLFAPIWCFGALLSLSSCGGEVKELITLGDETVPIDERESILGEGGFSLGGPAKPNPRNQDSGIGVNAFLWRASLDTLSVWPIASADPFGGVIISDWYTPPDTPDEKFKLNVFILGRSLRADGVRVSVFRQTRTPSGGWREAPVQQETQVQLENAILTRARQFRTESREQ
tara:strand:+ start:200 stop:724 length:525 start_codon:yes stop_codon:yes gene_type:complete